MELKHQQQYEINISILTSPQYNNNKSIESLIASGNNHFHFGLIINLYLVPLIRNSTNVFRYKHPVFLDPIVMYQLRAEQCSV